MFKVLAEYIMRGRKEAIIVALIGSWFPFVSQATLALVTLRRGWQDGLIVTLWASLPALVGIWIGNATLAVVLATVSVFVVAYIASYVLRLTISWPAAFSAAVAGASLAGVVLILGVSGVAEALSAFFSRLLSGPDGQVPAELRGLANEWSATRASGLIAYWVGVGGVVGLLLARWWQSLLYNPGGFQQEFHRLRLPIGLAACSGLASLYCNISALDYQFWAGVFGLPLMFSGLGLLHWLVARFKLGIGVIVAVYIAIPLVPLSLIFIMVLALLDAVLDLRSKLKVNQL